MSSYETIIEIDKSPFISLIEGTCTITKGSLVGDFPKTLPSGVITPTILVNAENPDDGSAGEFTYYVVIGGTRCSIHVDFACNNALHNFMQGRSSHPSIVEVTVSPYSPTDHPLRATVAVLVPNQE